jgi:hypothetical protein
MKAIFLREDKNYWLTPMGAWYAQDNTRQRWKYYADLEYLYRRKSWKEKFMQHPLITINWRSNVYSNIGTVIAKVPPQCYPVQAISRDTGYKVERTNFFAVPHDITPEPTESLVTQIEQLPESLKSLLADTELLIPETKLQTALSTTLPLYLASDGGAATKKGSYGWVLQAGNRPIAQGKGIAQGSNPRSYRV